VTDLQNTVKYKFTQNSYNTSVQVSEYTSQVNSGIERKYTFQYDDNGNIIHKTDTHGKESRYVYDDIGHLYVKMIFQIITLISLHTIMPET
jgi:YD repeat-containing protein